jgi:mediator of RNA polymerase II transcription subunit 7
LEEQGKKRLYSDDAIHSKIIVIINKFEEPIASLKSLNQQLLAAYTELLELLITNNSNYKAKIEEIELIIINMHHLLNLFRPHQARQTLITMLEEQIERRKQWIIRLQQTQQETQQTMDKVAENFRTVLQSNSIIQSQQQEGQDQQQEGLNGVSTTTNTTTATSHNEGGQNMVVPLDQVLSKYEMTV